MYKIIKNYQDDQALRASFNELAKKVFCLDFESWYQNGFWTDKYKPYSIVVDGIYLLANDSVLDFYPKFGFCPSTEYQYTKKVSTNGSSKVKKVPMQTKEQWDNMVHIITHSVQSGRIHMIDNAELFMFYLHSFMQECVYYIPELETYAIAEIEDGSLLLHSAFHEGKVPSFNEVIEAFGEDILEVTLGFTPMETDGFCMEQVETEDSTLFVKGEVFHDFPSQKAMLPTLSHA